MQTYIDIGHLVIDSDSKDKTVGIVLKHCNPKIRLLSKPDKGI